MVQEVAANVSTVSLHDRNKQESTELYRDQYIARKWKRNAQKEKKWTKTMETEYKESKTQQ